MDARHCPIPLLISAFFAANGISSELTTLSTSHNATLAASLNNLSSIPDVNIIPIDIYSLYNQVLANPGEFGFQNVTDSCVIGGLQNIQGVCNNPNDFYFFDDVHPTTGAQKIVAETVLSAIKTKSVPEPTSALGILALGGLGVAGVLKRKQKQSDITPTGRVVGSQSYRRVVES